MEAAAMIHNQSAYVNGKCKCEACRADHAFRSSIYAKASREAAKWVRRYHRQVFETLLDEAYVQAGVERRPQGRPAKAGHWSFPDPGRRLRLADIDARDGAA
jgi:hypothetical protein